MYKVKQLYIFILHENQNKRNIIERLMKIGILIPSTSNGRNWTSSLESYLYSLTLKTFLITYNQEHSYKFYIGIDRGDKIYDNPSQQQHIYRFMNIMKNVEIEFVHMDGIPKGHLTKMWNRLFQKAYDENCDYFFQCGDDIAFRTKGWINDCIITLENSAGIGMTGPINNNPAILTQSFVSRKHMELFGYYFPEEIVNWYCDDWMNEVYIKLRRFYPLKNHFCENLGGNPRYNVNNDTTFFSDNGKREKLREKCTEIVKRDLERGIQKINGHADK